MFRNDSKTPNESGFSLIEVLVGLVVSGILLVALTRFYKDSYRTFNLQEQITERNQNAYYTLNYLTEIMQQMGSGLPDTGYTVLSTLGSSPYPSFIYRSNPRGGVHFVSQGMTSATRIPVADTTSFKYATDIMVDFVDPATTHFFTLISGYAAGAAGKMDTIIGTNSVTLDTGDMIYAWKKDTVLLSGRNLLASGIVLAENVDTLQFVFYNKAGTATTVWKDMRSVSIKVSVGTTFADPRITSGDQYRKLTLKKTVGFKNRI